MKTKEYQALFFYSKEEIDAIRKFEREHTECMQVFGDISAALFEYKVVPSGLGTIKEVICSCGESLSLGDFLDGNEITVYRPVTYSGDQLIGRILDAFSTIRERPDLYFGNRHFASFWYWLAGIEEIMHWSPEGYAIWLEITDRITRKMMKTYLSQREEALTPELIVALEGSDEAAYKAWFKVFNEAISGANSSIKTVGQ